MKLRLLADGKIIDPVTQKYLGLIWGPDLEKAWALHGAPRQKFLEKFVNQ